jgi:hypothetical protein
LHTTFGAWRAWLRVLLTLLGSDIAGLRQPISSTDR